MTLARRSHRLLVAALGVSVVVVWTLVFVGWEGAGRRAGNRGRTASAPSQRSAWSDASDEVREALDALAAVLYDGSADAVPHLRRIDAGAPESILEVMAVARERVGDRSYAAMGVLDALRHRTAVVHRDHLASARPGEEEATVGSLAWLADWWDVPSRRDSYLDALLAEIDSLGGERLARRLEVLALADAWRPEYEALVRARLPTAQGKERDALLGLLARGGPEAAHLAPLVVALPEPTGHAAFQALVEMGPPDRDFLVEFTAPLRAEDSTVPARESIGDVLVEWSERVSAGHEILIPWLVSAAREGTRVERAVALRALARAGTEHVEVVRAVLREVAQERPPHDRQRAQAALETFEKRVERASRPVRRDALDRYRALSEEQLRRVVEESRLSGRPVDALRRAVEHDDPDVRVAAAHLLHRETGEIEMPLDVLRWELRSTQQTSGWAGDMGVSHFNATELRWMAVAAALERMGTRARPAADDLLAADSRTPQGLLSACLLAPLPRIAPGDEDVLASLRGRALRWQRQDDVAQVMSLTRWGNVSATIELVEAE